jgi:hypothetical protein
MNERIKDLAFQAMSINQKVSDDSFFVEVSKLNEFEKFAELIVNECAVYCAGHILPTKTAEENDLNYNDGIMDCAIGLKQHFGVEE